MSLSTALLPSPDRWIVRIFAAAVLGIALLWLWYGSWDAPYILAVLFAIAFWPSRSREILLLGLTIFILLPTRPFQIGDYAGNSTIWDVTEWWANLRGVDLSQSSLLLWVHVAVTIGALAFAWILVAWVTPRLRIPLIVSLTAVLCSALILFDRWSAEYSLAGLLTLTFLRVWCEIFISALVIQKTLAIRGFSATEFWKFMPFWNISGMPFWEFQRLPNSTDLKTHASQMRYRVIGLALLLSVVFIASTQLFHYIFGGEAGQLGLARDAVDGPIYVVKTSQSVLQAWLAFLSNGFGFLLFRLLLFCSVPALLLMSVGVPAKLNLQSPQTAISLHSFFTRIYYYYNRAMTTIFFRPVIERLHFLRPWQKLRVFLAIFISIEIFGGLYHFMHEFQTIVLLGLWPAICLQVQIHGVYFLSLGLLCGISAILPRWQAVESKLWLRVTLFLVFLMTMNFLYFLSRGVAAIPLRDKLFLLRYLFTGNT